MLAILFALLGCNCNDPPVTPPAECANPVSAAILTAETMLPPGPNTTSRPGDALLENDQIRVVIQGTGRSVAVNPFGGNIIDADLKRADGSFQDSFGEMGMFANLAGTSSADTIEVTPGCGSAQVRVEGTYVLSDYVNLQTGVSEIAPGLLQGVDLDTPWPLRFVALYTLEAGSRAVKTRFTLTNEGAEAIPLTAAWLIEAGQADAVVPAAESYDLATLGNAEYFVFDAADVAYGVLPLTDTRKLDRGYVSLVGGFALTHDDTFLSVLSFPDVRPLEAGASKDFDALFAVGEDHARVAKLLRDALDIPCTAISGVVKDPAGAPLPRVAVAAIEGPDGADLAHTRTGEDGSFSVCVPPGPIRVIAGAAGRPYAGGGQEPGGVDVTLASEAQEVEITLPATGRVEATVTDADGGPLASRVVVMGLDASPYSPRLEGRGYDPLAPGVVVAADSVDGRFSFDVEPGEYEVVISHGPEYSAVRQPLTVAAGSPATLSATLHRVVDTTGYMTGDFHVHAAASPDSTRTNTVRVRNMVAENVEILVSTDHDYVTDFGPAVAELGVQAQIATLTGEEITSSDYGHFNAFPLAMDPSSPNNGAIDWNGRTPQEIGEEVLAQPYPIVYQLNHPRRVPAPGAGGNYFQAIDLQFDANGPYSGPEALSADLIRVPEGANMLATNFTAIEVMTWLDVQGLHDWYNFLNAGHFFTATGNSDTHTQYVESSGWPRNYVFLGADDPATLTGDALANALNAGKNSVGFGVFTTVEVSGQTEGSMGATVTPEGGQVTARVHVQSPLWAPFDSVVLVDGATGTVLAGGPVTPAQVSAGSAPEAVRLDHVLEHTWSPAADTWVVAVAQGTGTMFPVFPYNKAVPADVTLAAIREGTLPGGATTFGITNPVFIDADSDGTITPSHLVLPPDWEQWRWEDRTNPY